MTRDFSHVLYLHYSFLAYDSIKTIMSMIIIELIITMILIMITIVIYWNVIGVLAALFSQIILYSCNRTDTFRPNISGWDNVWRKKILHYGNYSFFFLGWVVVAMVIVINSVSVPRVFVLLKKILCHQFLRSFKV